MGVYATITGNLTADPTHGVTDDNNPLTWVRFRVASNHRRRTSDGYADTPSTFWDVVAYGRLAENIHDSLKKGDPVIVTGSLNTSTYTPDSGEEKEQQSIKADNVGINLKRTRALIDREPKQHGND